MSLLRFPKDGFQQIEARINANPNLLKDDHWHTLPKGAEAWTEEEITGSHTAHCLLGWVIAVTPRAAAYEQLRFDVEEYAQKILTDAGRKPIPKSVVYSDVETFRKIIAMRAQEERIAAVTALQDFTLN